MNTVCKNKPKNDVSDVPTMLGRPAGRPNKYIQTSDVSKTSDVFPVGFIFQFKTYWRKFRLYDL
jgi:hypothetical protein